MPATLIWTYHHVLIDGWSTSRLVGDVLRHYRGQPLAPAGRYRDYIDWLRRQDAEATERFWRRRLAVLEEPTHLAAAMPPGLRGEGHEAVYTRWDGRAPTGSPPSRGAQRITLNTLVQGAWLLLLQRYTGQRTVAFGATVSGRPAELPGAAHHAGPVHQHPAGDPDPPPGRRRRETGCARSRPTTWRSASTSTRPLPGHPALGRAPRPGAVRQHHRVREPPDRPHAARLGRPHACASRVRPTCGVTNFPMDLMVTLEEDGLEIEYMFLRASFDRGRGPAPARPHGMAAGAADRGCRPSARAPGPGDAGRAPPAGGPQCAGPGGYGRAAGPSPDRAPGGGTAGGHGTPLRRCRAHLRRARCPQPQPRRLPAPARRRAGDPGRRRHAAQARPARQLPRRPQGGRRLCAPSTATTRPSASPT